MAAESRRLNKVKAEDMRPLEPEASPGDKMWKKAKETPFVPVGIAGSIAMLGWGAYQFRHKGQMSTSMYLMHLRVQTQSMIVGAMTMGVAYMLVRDYWINNKSHPEDHK